MSQGDPFIAGCVVLFLLSVGAILWAGRTK